MKFVLKNNINRVKIEHRYRIEQRWQNGKFANRFRYRLNPILPLNHKTVIPNTVFLTAFEELFFSNKQPYFRRSRFFVGAGYQFTKLFSMQAGYISQYENMAIPEDSYTKNFLHFLQ